LFEHWWGRLNMPFNKRIVPLGFAVSTFDLPFIRDWMGDTAFGEYFHGFPRDVLQVVNFLNDVSDFHAEQTPFNKFKLKEVARAVGVEVFESDTHAALYDAYLAAEVYKKLLNHHLLNPL
jgi:DNA polymerase III epsilon subunit-like protein